MTFRRKAQIRVGSHGASAVPLLATILAWGREGLCARVEYCMNCAERLAQFVQEDPRFTLLAHPQTGIVVWRPKDARVFDIEQPRLAQHGTPLSTLPTSPQSTGVCRYLATSPASTAPLLLDQAWRR